MSERASLYNEIHKGLRSLLVNLLVDCGAADPRSPDAIASLAKRLRDLSGMLEEHAGHEDTWVEPLVKELRPDVAQSLADAHKRLDAMMAEVSAAFSRWEEASEDERVRAGALAHGKFAAYVGDYLSHMSQEEDVAMPVLQAAMSDEQLLGVSAQLRGTIPPERMAEWMAIMLPAMNVEERTAMFMGMKANAPAPVVQGMCGLAANVLTAEDWGAVQSRVGL